MKSGWAFFWGIVTGGILTFAAINYFGPSDDDSSSDSSDVTQETELTGIRKEKGFTAAEQEIEFTAGRKFEVSRVLTYGALARCEDKSYPIENFYGATVYIVADGQNLFYNKQVIEVPKGKKPIQIGTYRHGSSGDVFPVIEFK